MAFASDYIHFYYKKEAQRRHKGSTKEALLGVEETLKLSTDPNLLMTPMLTPEYSVTCRLLIKSESIETCSTKPIMLNHIVIHTFVGRNPR